MSPLSREEVEAYRRPSLEALGRDDPLTVQSGEVALWRRLIEAAGTNLRVRPSEQEWSVIECLGHMVDSELVTSVRYRTVLAESEPELAGWNQEAWADQLDHTQDDPALPLEVLGALRHANIVLWRNVTPAARTRVGIHAERGPESLELLFRMQAGHGRLHRAQAEQAIADVRRARWIKQPFG